MTHDSFKLFLASQKIEEMVKKIAIQVDDAYPPNEPLVCVAVLKGAWIFHADLVRAIKRPVTIDFIRAASYGAGSRSSGTVRILKDVEVELRDKHVLLVEEIVDSGRTLSFIKSRLANSDARSVKIAALLDKKERREVECEVDFLGTEVPNEFLVGYGLDWNENYRNLADIYSVPGEVLK